MIGVANKYGYQDKELQAELGLDLLDFHARQYDPLLGRFHSYDPQSQFASGYVGMGNMPTVMVDPDGELAWFVIPVVVGVVSGTINAISQHQSGDNFLQTAANFGVGFGAGAAATLGAAAIAPAATAALGTGFVGGAAIGATGGAISGFGLGAGNTWLDGGSFGEGIVNGAIGAGTGAAIGGLTGGLFSGVKAAVQGRNFWSGASPWQAPQVAQIANRPDALGGSADDWTAPRSSLKDLPGQAPKTQLPDPVRLQGGDFTGLKSYPSLTDKFGSGYQSISVAQGKHLPVQLGQKLNSFSLGPWSKVYEAGLLNGSKVEAHYFYNANTGQYVNPFIKMGYWGSKAFKELNRLHP